MNFGKNYTMIDEDYFFDSYAIIELLKGNLRYQPYRTAGMVILKFNLFEVFYSYIREENELAGSQFLEDYQKFVQEFDLSVIRAAAKFKYENRKKELSMADCLGYCYAKELGIKFLTGDRQFEDLENVEFVK